MKYSGFFSPIAQFQDIATKSWWIKRLAQNRGKKQDLNRAILFLSPKFRLCPQLTTPIFRDGGGRPGKVLDHSDDLVRVRDLLLADGLHPDDHSRLPEVGVSLVLVTAGQQPLLRTLRQ